MTQDFTEVMSERSNEELIKITTIQRLDYQPAAVVAAEKELAKRNIDKDEVETTKEEILEKKVEGEKLEVSKVKSWVRFVHFFVDIITIFLIYIFVVGIITTLFIDEVNPMIAEATLPFLLFVFSFFYYIILEYKYQVTVGKILMKTKVVMKDGSVPELSDIIARTFCRIIPFDRISYLFTKNGFHDRLSSTMVVKQVEE